jgi:hypothetical protein
VGPTDTICEIVDGEMGLAAALNLDLRQVEQSLDALKAKKVDEPSPNDPRSYQIVAAAAPLARSPD